jgi:hypothetical protein
MVAAVGVLSVIAVIAIVVGVVMVPMGPEAADGSGRHELEAEDWPEEGTVPGLRTLDERSFGPLAAQTIEDYRRNRPQSGRQPASESRRVAPRSVTSTPRRCGVDEGETNHPMTLRGR